MKNEECMPIAVIELISRKWSLLIIKSLIDNGRLRYNELMHDLEGISPKTLTERLRELEREGIILRKMFPQIPPKVEYSLTRKGIELAGSLGGFLDWIKKWYPMTNK